MWHSIQLCVLYLIWCKDVSRQHAYLHSITLPPRIEISQRMLCCRQGAAVRITTCWGIFVVDDDVDDCTTGTESRWGRAAAAWTGGREESRRRLRGDVETRSWENVSSWLPAKGQYQQWLDIMSLRLISPKCQCKSHGCYCPVLGAVSVPMTLLINAVAEAGSTGSTMSDIEPKLNKSSYIWWCWVLLCVTTGN